MGKYNRILVAVDGSEPSLHALSEAFKLKRESTVTGVNAGKARK
ncbi:MAG: universal stress protein [Deltaproteobacteria bacterium]|nr:universal stress protein [Deltaproteobacteria bacterium]